MRTSALERLNAMLPDDTPVLDVGGWFIPCERATHVVDLFPYETRRGAVQLTPLPGERFTRETWLQLDCTVYGLRLPFPDKHFAFSVCSHTLEDFADPVPLLKELRRVSAAGYIETPSRLTEQTVGVEDARHRAGRQIGYQHHHWIVDAEGATLRFSDKWDSIGRETTVPLSVFERIVAADPDRQVLAHWWTDTLDFQVVRGAEAYARARAFRRSLDIAPAEMMVDAAKRRARRVRARLRGERPDDHRAQHRALIELSRPYSRVPLG